MKKIIAILLALVVICSFAACSTDSGNTSDPSDSNVSDSNTSDSNTSDSNVPDSSNPVAPAEESPAKLVYADFKEKVANGEKDAEALATALAANEKLPFNGATMPVEEGMLNGFDKEIKGFKKGVMFSPVIGTIPFVGYIFELADDADAEAFKTTLKDNANLRWNVCTEADEMVCESEGSLVFFVMAPAAFEE